jgi:hypothetical protein
VPPVWPSPAVTLEVEAVPVALAQPKGNMSSAGMPEQREALAESWTLGSCMVRVECGRRVGRSRS